MSEETFVCAICEVEFEKAWTDEEAAAEAKSYFGDIPQEEKAVVCDDCFNKVHPRKFPIATAIAKAENQSSRHSVAPTKSGTSK